MDSMEQSWLGKAQFLIEGVIHEYDPSDESYLEWTKIKHIPKEHVVATFDGCWQKRVYWKRAVLVVLLHENDRRSFCAILFTNIVRQSIQ